MHPIDLNEFNGSFGCIGNELDPMHPLINKINVIHPVICSRLTEMRGGGGSQHWLSVHEDFLFTAKPFPSAYWQSITLIGLKDIKIFLLTTIFDFDVFQPHGQE